MITTMAMNCSSTRSRISFCDVLPEPPRIILMRPRRSTTATAPMAIGTDTWDMKSAMPGLLHSSTMGNCVGNRTWPTFYEQLGDSQYLMRRAGKRYGSSSNRHLHNGKRQSEPHDPARQILRRLQLRRANRISGRRRLGTVFLSHIFLSNHVSSRLTIARDWIN